MFVRPDPDPKQEARNEKQETRQIHPGPSEDLARPEEHAGTSRHKKCFSSWEL